jgi:hypothetical protein
MENNPELPICFRVASADLDSDAFAADIQELMGDLSCKPAQVFLVLDFKDQSALSEAAIESFVALLQERINELPHLHDWLGFAVALSSFPTAIKLKPGEVQAYPRTDLVAYGKLLHSPKDLLRVPMFGDYAVDTSPLQKPQRRTPSAHLRYSTPKNYIVSKGHSVKKPHGYKSIYPVADALVVRADFMGPGYSEGDNFISELSNRGASTGNASSWRWASTDHHLTMNIRAINSFFGIVEQEIAKSMDSAEAQGLLFSDLAAPSTAPLVPLNSLVQS